MRYETTASGVTLPRIGLGTWDIGGRGEADRSQDTQFIDTLQRLIEMGYTHLDTAEAYGATHTEELVGAAIRAFKRSDLFITTKVSPEHLRYDDVHRSIQGSLRRLGTDYVDLYLIHWPNHDIPLEETFRALNELVANGSVRHIGVSNFDVPLLKRSVELCKTPLLTDQVRYNLLHRRPVENGVLQYCQKNDILLTAYSPLKDGVLTHPVVAEIALAHNATPAQIALAWLIAQPKVITIPKTSNLARARDNLAALDIQLTDREMEQLNGIA